MKRERHGATGTPEYRSYREILFRCLSPSCPAFAYYGGRGITVCEEWRSSFAAFLAYVGPRPSPRHSIDRIDNNRGYEPGNVRWATRLEQSRNRRNVVHYRFGDELLTLTEISRRTGIPYSTLLFRRRSGWSQERMFSEPVGTWDHRPHAKRGSDHPYARLTEDDVRAVRAAYANGESGRKIAKRLGMSQGAIQHITSGKTWRHLG